MNPIPPITLEQLVAYALSRGCNVTLIIRQTEDDSVGIEGVRVRQTIETVGEEVKEAA